MTTFLVEYCAHVAGSLPSADKCSFLQINKEYKKNLENSYREYLSIGSEGTGKYLLFHLQPLQSPVII